MNAPASVRIDKWLWAIRLFKTRGLATEACRHGRVTVGGQAVKPSRDVKISDLIVAKTGDITRTVKVLALLEHRVGAQMVREYAEDLTPASEYEKPRERFLQPLFSRPKGAGRPTKKDRRQMDKLF
ncbi:MAG: RNA-binding protein [Pedosphaera sp.]|nr:RNA-binding protein [Pedosphaera sp.]